MADDASSRTRHDRSAIVPEVVSFHGTRASPEGADSPAKAAVQENSAGPTAGAVVDILEAVATNLGAGGLALGLDTLAVAQQQLAVEEAHCVTTTPLLEHLPSSYL